MATIVVAGGSGFLGRYLRARFERDRHRVLTLTRRPKPGVATDLHWQPDGNRGPWADRLEGVEAVFNLAGENIGEKRWTTSRKRALRESRLLSTRSLVDAVQKCRTPPRVFVSASGSNYYGAHGDEPVTERRPPGHDFLAEMCVAWEREASRLANHPTTRLAIARSGLVMGVDGGALKEMIRPFRFGLGATLGTGRQFMPWIHVDDWTEMAAWLVATDAARGPFNFTSPTPVTNREFTKTLASVLRRPAVFQAPGFAVKLILGEVAEFLLTGQRLLPAHAERMGFQFRFRELEPALRDLLRK
ncbi:MAG: TIGR01777 family oxidoreductase [Vicinamibacterales bacterium]